MCKVIEDMLKEERAKGFKEGMRIAALQIILRMPADGTFPLEEIAEITDLPLDEVKKLQTEHCAQTSA